MRLLLVGATGLLLLVAGCSSHAQQRGSIGATQPTSTTVAAEVDAAVSGPSADARYVCSEQAASELARVLGDRAVKILNPVWSHDRYSCEYRYVPQARVLVSVAEFATTPDATRAFEQRHAHLSDIDSAAVCHDDCYVTRNGLALLRNGNEVLFVDASRLPGPVAGMNRAENALSVLAAVTPP